MHVCGYFSGYNQGVLSLKGAVKKPQYPVQHYLLYYVVFEAALLCACDLGLLQLPKFPNYSESTWPFIRCIAGLILGKLFVSVVQRITLT